MSKLSGIKKIHFVGAGGISMSALAKLMLLQGKKVTGSDLNYSKELESLIEWGVDIWVGHQPENIRSADLVVYTSAVPENDPELVFARENGIPTVVRHHFLGELSKDYDNVVAVSGTHGKTTTTGMLAVIFDTAGEVFTAHLGGNLPGRGNIIFKGYRHFITEACEYKKSMLSLDPDIAVVLNVEPDHPDTYASEEELYAAFDQFLGKFAANGKAVICGDCSYYKMRKDAYANACTFGIGESARVRAEEINEYKNGYFEFFLSSDGQPVMPLRLAVPGYHNVYNALAAYCAANLSGVPNDKIKAGIESFHGVERRFEVKGAVNKAPVIIDYAHHPTEIKATIATAKCLRPRRLIVVFQPHTYSRTQQLYKEFLAAFGGADRVYIFKEYAARETPDKGMSAYDLYKGLRNAKIRCQYFGDIIALARALAAEAEEGDAILILGAGDIALLGDLLTTK